MGGSSTGVLSGKPVTPCLLSSLVAPVLQGWLPGLIVDHEEIRIDRRQFLCCDGGGLQLDLTSNTTSRCALQDRLRQVQRLLRQCYVTWGYVPDLQQTWVSGMQGASQARWDDGQRTSLQRLGQIREGHSRKGRVLKVSPDVGHGPAAIWGVALAAAWRYGLHPHVVTLGRTAPEAMVPLREAKCSVILVEQVDRLWDIRIADDLEWLISYAYGAMLPLWLEVRLRPRGGEKAGDGDGGRRGAFARRIARARTKSMASGLSDQAASKLRVICDDAHLFFENKSESVKPRLPAPRLPWDPV